MRARARDARRVRALLPRQRPRRGDASTRSRRARSATPRTRTSFLARAHAALRAADSRAQPRGGGPLRLSRGGQLDDARATAACSISAAARCSSCACASASPASRAPGALGTVRMSERFLPAERARPSASSSRSCASTSPPSSSTRHGWRAPARDGDGAAPGRDRRHRAQPRGGRPARRRAAVQRRAGDGHRRAPRSRSSSSGSPRCRPPSARACPASSRRAPT